MDELTNGGTGSVATTGDAADAPERVVERHRPGRQHPARTEDERLRLVEGDHGAHILDVVGAEPQSEPPAQVSRFQTGTVRFSVSMQ